MNDEAFTNTAQDSAYVGAQFGTVHGDVTLYEDPYAAPPVMFELGVRYLDGGMPAKARELIGTAVMRGHRTSEAHFHWLLAHLSGRTRHQLSEEDDDSLAEVPKLFDAHGEDEWTAGLRVIARIIDAVETAADDVEVLGKELDALARVQRSKILRHLDTYLAGPIRDRVWERTVELAEKGRHARRRGERVWKFFEPTPKRPRPIPVDDLDPRIADQVRLALGGGAFLAAITYAGALLFQNLSPVAFLAYLGVLLGAYACGHSGLIWFTRRARMREEDARFLPPTRKAAGADGGFAAEVTKDFKYYFGKYVPRDGDYAGWRERSKGMRQRLRHQIVDMYREERTSAGQIRWLVRFLASDARTRWENGSLFAYATRLRTPTRVKAAFVLGAVPLLAGGAVTMLQAVFAAPLTGTAAVCAAVAGAWGAARGAVAISAERMRYADEQAEARAELDRREAAYERWCRKLADRPSDLEMARWLECDRRVLIERVLRHYKLTPSAVIAQAVIEAPRSGTTRKARVRNGPWRYSAYRLVLFLLTTDGVRQTVTDLDFEYSSFTGNERTNYRFDAVASVRVDELDGYRRFALTLVNGKKIAEQNTEEVRTDEREEVYDAANASVATLEASGMTGTLHVLEGIAAEGREWIRQETRRGGERMTALRTAVHHLLSPDTPPNT